MSTSSHESNQDEAPSSSQRISRRTLTGLRTSAVATASGLTALLSTVGLASAQVGSNYCTPAVPNSTGQPARITAAGSSNLSLNNNQLTLRVDNLPLNRFGFFITSRAQGLVANPGGSQGTLCLGGTVGRYVGPGQVLNSGLAGSFDLLIDLSMTPEGGSFVQVVGGDTWNFQAWYRDIGPGGQPWSNLSDGLEVQFTGVGVTPIPGMMPIPAGTFRMGSNGVAGPPYFAPVLPVHQVTISYPFWMGRHEVTQGEYQALMGANPASYPGATHPVETVSWHLARAYCTALTAQQAGNLPAGYEYRLPTEAEWEYACRAGTTTEFHYGTELFCDQARFNFSLDSNSYCDLTLPNLTVPVGRYAPNAFGLYDMHGNVFEWCLDSPAPYNSGPITDPFVTGGWGRIIRGGGWPSWSDGCRSASRYTNIWAEYTDSILGFRVVLAPALVP